MKVRWGNLLVATELPKTQEPESREAPTGHRETPPPGRPLDEIHPIVALTRSILALTTVIVLGHLLVRPQHEAPVSVTVPASQQAAAPAPRPTPPATPQPAASTRNELVSFPHIPRGAIVLQVAALTSQGDAFTMAEKLRQSGFPAFVRPPSTDSFHRVQVGPYSDPESAKIAKRKLKKAGYAVINKH